MLIKTSRRFDGIAALVLLAASVIVFVAGGFLQRHGFDMSLLEYALVPTIVFGITFAVRWLNRRRGPA